MATPTEWQEHIERACASVGLQQVNVLLDQADWNNCAVPALKMLRPQVPWFSLFSGTPEENLLDQAPLLMRLNLTHWQHKAWLEELLTQCATEARLLVVISPLPFDTLSQALQALSQVKWGARTGLLRYYDPRIFPLLTSAILTDNQRTEYLQAVNYWGWLDRDDQPQWLQGNCLGYHAEIEVKPFLNLSDQQGELIGCIGDAQKLLDEGDFDDLEATRELRFAALYSIVVQAHQENHLDNLTEYARQKL